MLERISVVECLDIVYWCQCCLKVKRSSRFYFFKRNSNLKVINK